MNSTYKVIVCGPGGIGRACIKELIRRPEFEIVGALAWSENKEGVDIGKYVGSSEFGVNITTDQEAILALEADCVLWCVTFPFEHMVNDMNTYVVRLLESGKSVITPSCYHYPPHHGQDYAKMFEDACKKGNSSLHGTGENPGFWLEKVALTLTGACNEVEYIKLKEYADVATSGTSTELLHAFGMGVPHEVAVESMKQGPLSYVWGNYFYVETLQILSMSICGKQLDRFEHIPTYHVSDIDFQLNAAEHGVDFEVKAGQVCAQTHIFNGYVDGELKFQQSNQWFLAPEYAPFDGREDSYWEIEIEGKPTSLKCTFDGLASAKDHLKVREGDMVSPTWYITVVNLIQSIPVVCAHEPGIVYPTVFTSAVPDLRTLATRKSVIG